MRLQQSSPIETSSQPNQAFFEKVELISKSDTELVLAFTGRDQSGLLLKAAQALANQNLNIRWAKVHTWGRQIQDLFAVDLPKLKSVDEVMSCLALEVTRGPSGTD